MRTTYLRFIGVAIAVCLFAVGMGTYLNYNKLRTTIEQLARDQALITAASIEQGIETSLALGMDFAELPTLPGIMAHALASDRQITAIEIFDPRGRILYSTQASRLGASVPQSWLGIASRGKDHWSIWDAAKPVAGITLRNRFKLPAGYLALHYDRGHAMTSVREAGRRLALAGAVAFIIASLLVSLVLAAILRRFDADMLAVGSSVGMAGAVAVPEAFVSAMDELNAAIASAEADLGGVRAAIARVET
jgi:hypothetical protein